MEKQRESFLIGSFRQVMIVQKLLGPIIALSSSKTEFAYLTGTGQDQDSCRDLSPSAYINVIKLYLKKIVRIPNPFVKLQLIEGTSNFSLDINSKNLFIAQGQKMFSISIPSLFSDSNQEIFTSIKSSIAQGLLQASSIYSINNNDSDDGDFNQSFGDSRRRIKVHKSKSKVSQKQIEDTGAGISSSEELISIVLPENRVVLCLHYDIKQTSLLRIYTVDVKQDKRIVQYTYDGANIEEVKSQLIENLSDKIREIQVTDLPQKRESLLTIISESGSWVILNSQDEVFCSSFVFLQYLKEYTPQTISSHHIRVGFESIYVKLLKGKNKCLRAKYDEGSDKLKLFKPQSVDYFIQEKNFTECYMSERFIRLNVELYADMKLINSTLTLVHSGRVLSFLDLGVANQRQWTHYLSQENISYKERNDFPQLKSEMDDNEWKGFGQQPHEVKEIFFFGNTQLSNTIRVIMVQKNRQLKQIVYYPEKKSVKLIQMKPIQDFKIGRVVSHFNSINCNTQGGCNSGIYFEVRSEQKLDLYTSTPTNQFRLLAKDLDPNLQLLRVIGAPHSLLFLADKQKNILYIFTIPPNLGLCEKQSDLMLCLTEEYPGFTYRPYLKCYLSNDRLFYIENGNLLLLNLQSKKFQTIDFWNQLTQIWIEDEGMYAKDRSEQIFYLENDIIFNSRDEAKFRLSENLTFQVMWKPLFTNSLEQIYPQFEADPICNRVATFQSSTQLVVLGQLGSLTKGFDNAHNFSRRILTFNIIEDPLSLSDYNSIICGLNSEHSQIIIWSIGSGKVQNRVQIEEDFSKFKFHSFWDDFSLIYAAGPNPDTYIWHKIKVTQKRVEISASFTHRLDHSMAHKLFINSNNDRLLEFRDNLCIVHNLKSEDSSKSEITIKLCSTTTSCFSPIYFSPTFETFISFPNVENIQLFRFEKSSQTYQRDEEFNLNQVVASETTKKEQNQELLLELISDNELRYVNTYGIEQTISIDDMKVTKERVFVVDGEVFEGKRREITNQARRINAMDNQQMLSYASMQKEGTCTRSQRLEALLLANNNLQTIQEVNHYNWRLIEAIVNDQIDVSQIEKLEILLDINLPNGDTLIHLMTQRNCKNLIKTLNIAEQKGLLIKICPNFKGLTPLHYCVKDTNITVASRFLDIISKYPLGDAASHIKDIMAELMVLCPIAFSQYLDSRLIEVPWTPQYSEGPLKAINGQDFTIGLMNLCPNEQTQIKDKFFEVDDTQQELSQKQRFPIKMLMCDIPDLHLLSDKIGQKMLFQLIKMKNLESIFSSKYIQAMIESQWDLLEQPIITKTLYPYLMYLVLFNIYVLYIVVQENTIMMNLVRYLVETSLLVLIYLDFKSKFSVQIKDQSLKYHIWFFLDIIPRILALISILMHYIFGGDKFIFNLYAFAIFCTWIGLMCFLRLNRGTGYLVRLIFEVIQDMYYFLTVMGLHMFAFTSAFYVLQQNNSNDGTNQVDNDTPYNIMIGYLQAAAFTYQLLIGNFDTSTFNPDTIVLSWFFFVVATVLLIIVMLNLLISIISNTFQKVQSQSNEKMYGEFVRLIFENKHYFEEQNQPVDNLSSRYLYVAQVENQKNGAKSLSQQSNSDEVMRILREIQAGQLQQELKIETQIKSMKEQMEVIKERVFKQQ